MDDERPARGTRPRNRRALILDAASDLFVRVGYPRVAMSDIAGAVAIAPSALYRHFRGKEDLLFEAVRGPFSSIVATLEDAAGSTEDLLDVLADGVLDRRGLGVLWQRESRHLPPLRRDELRHLLVKIERILSERLRAARPELNGPRSDLLAWAAMAAAMSVAFQRVELPRAEYAGLLAAMVRDVVSTELDPLPDAVEAASGGVLPVAQEADTTAARLVAAAARLFAERGFQSVGIDEVGAEVGIAGPSVYHHFAGKAELLDAAIGDGARALLSEQAEILARDTPAEEQLVALMRSYVDFSFAHHHVLDLMITETQSLGPDQAARSLQQQRDYVAAWLPLLASARPDLPTGHARVRLQAALTVTNDISRTAHLSAQPGVRTAVTAIGTAVLLGLRPPDADARLGRRGSGSPAG